MLVLSTVEGKNLVADAAVGSACTGRTEHVKQYYVYIMTNKRRTLYTGVTNNLERRVSEHQRRLLHGFTTDYSIRFLLYYEAWPDIRAAIAREKQIKGWARARKMALIESVNPAWRDLSHGWLGGEPSARAFTG